MGRQEQSAVALFLLLQGTMVSGCGWSRSIVNSQNFGNLHFSVTEYKAEMSDLNICRKRVLMFRDAVM